MPLECKEGKGDWQTLTIQSMELEMDSRICYVANT